MGAGRWIAVFMRLGSVTRPTADADTVARSQAELLDRLVADEVATIVSGGEVEVPTGDSTIEVDVMDLADDPLPGDTERRAFALARRYALDTAVQERIVVSDGAAVVAEATIPVATIGPLTTPSWSPSPCDELSARPGPAPSSGTGQARRPVWSSSAA